MTKLLVSDYDGTFIPESKSIEELKSNRDAVKRFLSLSNIFAFATGRHFNSIKSETLTYELPYNYLICNNGTSIFDSKDNLIHYNLIPFSIVIRTIKYLNRKKVIKSIKYNDIYGNETRNFKEVAEIVCVVDIPSPSALEELKDELAFLQTIYFTINSSQYVTVADEDTPKGTQYLIVKKPSDKKEAVKFISNIEGILLPDIYTIGNDFNDYGMIECYNGFKMIDSRSELELLDAKEVSSIRELVKRIEG